MVKNITPFLLKQYSKMPGKKKIAIAMELSELARQVNRQGSIQTNVQPYGGNKSAATS
jgi:hypothetical protein